MRKLAVILSLVFLALPVFAADAWVDFNDPQGIFRVSFPQAPQSSSTSTKAADGTDIPLTQYMVADGDSAVMVMVGDFSGRTIDPQALVNGVVQSFQSQDRTLISRGPDLLDGQSGENLVLTDTDGDRLRDRIFFVKGKLYQVLSVIPKDATQEDADIVSRFSASFHFN